MIMERILPRFVVECHVHFKAGDLFGDDYPEAIAMIYGDKLGFSEYIILNDDAPKWAHYEYSKYRDYHDKKNPFEESRNFKIPAISSFN